jgi:hydrogenase nickel incorporation protein HypA/HybF
LILNTAEPLPVHELALSQDIVKTVLRATDVPEERISGVVVDVGELSSVNVDSLEFCLKLAFEERGMERTAVQIHRTPAEARCRCGATYQPETMFAPCPECGGFDRELLRGMDVTIRYVEVEDEQG